MPYTKLSEYVSKKLFSSETQIVQIVRDCQTSLENAMNFLELHSPCIIKVDQFVKRRGKKGLLKTDITTIEEVKQFIDDKTDYRYFVLEPMIEIANEKYIAFRREAEDVYCIFCEKGGIHLENPEENGIVFKISEKDNQNLGDCESIFNPLLNLFERCHGRFLEINPIAITSENQIIPADFAFEVDNTSFHQWSKDDLTLLKNNSKQTTEKLEVEQVIEKLDHDSGASLKFTSLNPNGKIWTLIAGGGASVIFTDAIVSSGYVKELANYGEYSGNPSKDEVYKYCDYIFEFLLNQKHDFKKGLENIYLFIGGGISNFTDVSATFDGIISAIEKHLNKFLEERVIILVRRGGVNEERGLSKMSSFLQKSNIPHKVYGSDKFITSIVEDNLPKLELNPWINKYEEMDKTLLKCEDINMSTKDFWTPNLGFIGRAKSVIQRVVDFDYLVGKEETSVKFIYDPIAANNEKMSLFWGSDNISIPVFNNISELKNFLTLFDQEFTILNYSSMRSCVLMTEMFLELTEVRLINIIAEGVAEKDSLKLKKIAAAHNKYILGPSSLGGINSAFSRLGNAGGKNENIVKNNLQHKGRIGLVTKSGGLLNEFINFLNLNDLHVNQAIAVGGDRYPCLTLADVALMYSKDPTIDFIIMIGEEGGIEELKVANLVENHTIKKKVIAWCSGISSDYFNEDIEFGHAGASATNKYEKASFKNYLMREMGVIVPKRFELMQAVLEMQKKGYYSYNDNVRDIPIDFEEALKDKKIRVSPAMINRVSDERKDLYYSSVPINNILEKDYSLGKSLSLLWFGIEFEDWAAKYIEKIMSVMADHGPLVSGAQNTIVASRAGKDVLSALTAGLLTIGPRFGGAIHQSAVDFYKGVKNQEGPEDFVRRIKGENRYISGIGHRIKSKFNPDVRVQFLKEYVERNFPNKTYFDYACEIEKATLKKRSNLILNVDGAVGASFLDVLVHHLNKEEIEQILETDILNGLFAISRSIGLTGHYFDQKMLGEGLYRAPGWMVEYVKKK